MRYYSWKEMDIILATIYLDSVEGIAISEEI